MAAKIASDLGCELGRDLRRALAAAEGLLLVYALRYALPFLWLALWFGLPSIAAAQGVTTTTVQGTVYLANGQVGSGTLLLTWPSFTTASGQSVAADKLTVTIAPDGFISVNLAPNLGATPAGLYYTAVYYLSDGSTNTQYWVIPAAASASLAQVQARLMPAAQAVQAVSKTYVDEQIAEAIGSLLTASGGTLTGPLYLNGDPTQPLQAADKHYVDETFAEAVPLAGGNMTGALQSPGVNGVESPLAGSAQTTLQAAMNTAATSGAVEIPPAYAGSDTFNNPNGLYVNDLRAGAAQQRERSVKEFGAVCDGVTDDTNALQAAINYANGHAVALTIPQGTCKTRTLAWHGESIGGLGKQVSALMGFPGEDVLVTSTDSLNVHAFTRIHDLTIYVDQSADVSCSAAEGRAAAGACTVSRLMENNSIFSAGGNGLTGRAGTGAAWAVGNCAIAMPAVTGAGGNGLREAEIENVEIAPTGADPLAAQYSGAHSTHTCGLYLAQWPQWSEFRNLDIRGLNTGIAIPPLAGATPTGLNADSNRWQNITIQATHAFTVGAGSNNVLDNVVAMAGNSAATGEPPTGLVLDFSGTQQGWTVRNAVVLPTWNAVQPQLTVSAAGGAVTAVAVGTEHGLGFDPYGVTIPLVFSGACTAQANASVASSGAITSVAVTAGGTGCSGTTTASINAAGTWDTAAPVNLVSGQNQTLFAGNLLKGNGGYTVWNAANSQSNGTQLDGGGGNLPGGGTYPALVANAALGSALQVDQFPGVDFGAKVQACVNALSSVYGGTCDARNFTGAQSMGSNLNISTGNVSVLLPCATITTANQIIVSAGTRNVSLRGCALQGGSAASGSQGGTAFLYSGTGAMFKIGDPTYASDTAGFHLDNAVINITAASAATAQGLIAYRAQELNLEELYFLGNANQTGMTLDGTGNYTGGSFFGNHLSGFQTAISAIGHQAANAATTDWLNASTFVRMHIDCPTSSGNPISGTTGFNLAQGDGNTVTGGDVEGCNTALHLGANAENNTILGMRNENSNSQVVADAGSAYNSWVSGGVMFTGKLIDNGTRNSFFDTFHRSFNGLNGDWYGSQQDATVTDHERLGIGLGNERGRVTEFQTDYGYRWQQGLGDGVSGLQSWFVNDMLNNVNRIAVGQYLSTTANVVTNVILNNGGCYTSPTAPAIVFSGGSGSGAAGTASMTTTSSPSCAGGYTVSSVTVGAGGSGYTTQPAIAFSGSNQTAAPNAVAEIATNGGTINQTLINAAGSGGVVLNGSSNAGTGGVIFGSGGASETTVATVDNAGDAQFNGALMVGGTTQSTGTTTVRNNADAEVDYYLWPGLTASQKGSYTYKDWNGASQWYLVKDASNNWSVNSAIGGLDSFKAYQSSNSGDTYVNAANSSGVVRINYEPGSGTQFKVYGGSSSSIYASFTGTTAIQFPGLAAASGHNCVQVDNSGYLTNTGAACGSGGGGGGSGTVNSATAGQIAYYASTGTAVSGESQLPITAGGTGAATAAAALTNLGAQAAILGLSSDGANGIQVVANGAFGGAATMATLNAKNLDSIGPRYDVTQFGAVGNGTTDDTAAIQAAFTKCYNGGTEPYGGVVEFPGTHTYNITGTIYAYDDCRIEGVVGSSVIPGNPTEIQWNGSNTVGTVMNLSSFTIGTNLAAITLASNPISGDTVTVNGVALTFGSQVTIGGTTTLTATNLFNYLNASSNASIVRSQPFTNGTAGVVTFAAGGGFPAFVPTVATSDAAAIRLTPVQYPLNSPPGGNYPAEPLAITFAVSNTLSQGNWVILQGFTQMGITLNRMVAQVTQASSSSFTITWGSGINIPNLGVGNPLAGTFTDSGTATTLNVAIAFDYSGRFENEVKDIQLSSAATTPSKNIGVGIYFGGRLDTGSRVVNAWIEGNPNYFGYYLADGGINVEFDKAWREDGAGLAGIYWRIGAGDNFRIANGTDNVNFNNNGAALMIDNSACQFGNVEGTLSHVDMESDPYTLAAGLGIITLYDCGPDIYNPQFLLNLDGVTESEATQANTGVLMSPANDLALQITVINSSINGQSAANRWVGLPTLARNDVAGSNGWESLLNYTPSLNSIGTTLYATGTSQSVAPTQFLNDVNLNQLWQYGVKASAFLYSDTSYAALPNATTLFAGQILAPPSYWNGANGNRYALDVVYTSGTTGLPNAGATTCKTTSIGDQFLCTSATDLSAGQHITVGADTNRVIQLVDATNPTGVLVWTTTGLSTVTSATVLTFAAPVLGPEIQMPTKSSAAPSTLAWAVGDTEQNSAASANGVAAWVNVATGSPGTWAGVPLGNASGVLSLAQVASGTTSTAPVCPNGTGGALTTSGCGISSFSGSTTTFANNTASTDYLVVEPGTTGTAEIGALEFASAGGTSEWEARDDATYNFHLRNTGAATAADVIIGYSGGQLVLNSQGSGSVAVNNVSTSGTGGFVVYEGGTNYNTAALGVSSSGNTTAAGFVSAKSMMGAGTMTLATGSAAGTSPAIACTTSHVCDGISGTVTLTTGTGPSTGTLATLTFPSSHSNYVNCMVDVLQSGVGRISPVSWTETASVVTLTANSALTASTAYTVKYWCGGN
jgi:Pectate lyase superfamily protein